MPSSWRPQGRTHVAALIGLACLIAAPATGAAAATPAAQGSATPVSVHAAPAVQGTAPHPAPVAQTSRAHVCPSTRAVRARTAAGAHVERAIVCLINRVRLRAGLRPLHMNHCLDQLAERHARDMVAHRYFAHDSASGRSLWQRAQAFGYSSRSASWTVGENLAWGAGRSSRALWVVEAWMRSPGHRANILRGSFRHIGVAAVRGIPTGIRRMRRPRTFTVDFGAGGHRCG